MKKVINVDKSEVFTKLSERVEVYALCVKEDVCLNLRFETVDVILDYLSSDYVFFVAVGNE